MFARLSYSRNLLIQNKLGPLIREPNFHDSFRKTIRYYIFSGIRPPISLSFSQAIRQVSVSRGDRHPSDFFIVFSGDSPSFCLTG